MDTDEDLLEAWREGDADAGEALVDRYLVPLERFFRNKVSSGVEDLIQSTMLGLLEARDRYRGTGTFRSYLFGVAYNTLRNHYRDSGRFAEAVDVTLTSLVDLGDAPSQVVARAQEQRVLLEALRRIPVEHQVLLELYFWEPLSAAEIGAIFDVPEGTVRTRIRRARTLLERAIAEVASHPSLLKSTLSNLDQWAESIKKR